MSKIVKYAAVTLGTFVVLVGVGAAGLYAWTNKELKATVADPTHAFAAPTDSASIARGEHVREEAALQTLTELLTNQSSSP